MSGTLDLSSSVINGDAFIVFDPDRGPNVKAEFAKFSGRLDIYPTACCDRFTTDDWIDSCRGSNRGFHASDRAGFQAEGQYTLLPDDKKKSLVNDYFTITTCDHDKGSSMGNMRPR